MGQRILSSTDLIYKQVLPTFGPNYLGLLTEYHIIRYHSELGAAMLWILDQLERLITEQTLGTANCVSETVLWTQELPSQNCRKWNRKPSKWIQQALHYMLRFRLQKDVLRFFYNIENIQEQSFSPPVKWIVVVATMWLLWRIPSDWVDALTLDRPGKVSRKARQHNLRRHRPNVAWKHMSNGADEDTDLEDSRISTRWQHAILQFVMFHHTLQIFNLMLLGTLGRLLAEHTEMIMPGAPRCHGQNQSSPLPLRCPMPLTQSPMALT